jgi:alpha-1,2-mannosyltransferase
MPVPGSNVNSLRALADQPSPARSSPARGRVNAFSVACALWLAAFAVTISLVVAHAVQAIPYGAYAEAGRHWLRHEPLYDLHSIDGFQYFPQAAIVFAPFAWLGSPAGDVAWRALGWFGYAWGLWRLSRQWAPRQAERCFLLTTCFAVLSVTNALSNGQANLALAALILHVAADLAAQRHWRATLLLAFGLGLKPLMIVLLLLTWPLYPALRWRVPLGLGALIVSPWLLRDHAYVVAQYRACWLKLQLCATPNREFEDLQSMFDSFGFHASQARFMGARALAALGCFGLAVWTRKRVREPRASLLVAMLAGSYLVLFNPRTLSSSYALTVGPGALLAAVWLLERRTRIAAASLAIVLCWTVSYQLLPFIQHWLRPLACSAWLALLIHYVASSDARRPA